LARGLGFRIRPGDDGPIAVVMLSTHPFTGLWQRPQQLAVRLARSYPVLYVCPRYASQIARERSPAQTPPLPPPENLLHLSPLLLPFERAVRPAYNLNLGTICYLIETALSKIGANSTPVLWFYAPRFAPLLHRVRHSAVVYDIMDEHSGFRWARFETEQLERELLSAADVAFAGTFSLYESKRRFASRMLYVPCGVEYSHFAAASDRKLRPPKALAGAKGPVIGYFGAVDDRLDFETILLAAEKHPEWTIVLAGPWFSRRPRHQLQSKRNIILTGLVAYSELPAYLARFDVALLPFVINDITRHIHPTKVLEYLASKTPVVASPIPDLVRFYSGIVRIGRTPEEFIAAIEDAIARPDKEALDRGAQMAKAASWDDMARKMVAALEEATSCRKQQT